MELDISYKGKTSKLPVDDACTLGQFHDILHDIYKISPEHQKLMTKGVTSSSLSDKSALVKNIFQEKNRIILMGSTDSDIERIRSKQPDQTVFLEDDQSIQECWENEEKHAKIIKMGLPTGAKLPVCEGASEGTIEGEGNGETQTTIASLPADKTITHLRNIFGNKLRMTLHSNFIAFKTDFGSQDLPHEDIIDIQSQSISSLDGYSIVRIKTKGNYVSKNYFVYFVPNGYVPIIKMTNISNWMFPENIRELLGGNVHTSFRFD